MSVWWGADNDIPIGEEAMAKIVCNHCRAKFTYKSKHYTKEFDKAQLLINSDITEINSKYYCQPCMKTISDQISKEIVVKQTERWGMKILPDVIPTTVSG